jgi:hypothetical protein
VNATVPLVPFAVVTVTVRDPVVEDRRNVRTAVMEVDAFTMRFDTDTPSPLTEIDVSGITKFVPVIVTVTAVPLVAVLGVIVVSVGTIKSGGGGGGGGGPTDPESWKTGYVVRYVDASTPVPNRTPKTKIPVVGSKSTPVMSWGGLSAWGPFVGIPGHVIGVSTVG